MSTVERLYEEVMALTEAEREALLSRIESDRLSISPELLAEWVREAKERLRRIDEGEPTIPWEVVRARMYERIRAANP